MSMSHKAFAFDWIGFDRELAPTLALALKEDATAPLEAFIDDHLDDLCDPYEGEPLLIDWRALLSVGDVQEVSDFALTKYYRLVEDFGVGDNWLDLSTDLSESQQRALLGEPFGEKGHLFDPGRMGAYFQSPERVAEALRLLQVSGDERLEQFIGRLSEVVAAKKGLYVTF